jgi:hypothetical protein
MKSSGAKTSARSLVWDTSDARRCNKKRKDTGRSTQKIRWMGQGAHWKRWGVRKRVIRGSFLSDTDEMNTLVRLKH